MEVLVHFQNVLYPPTAAMLQITCFSPICGVVDIYLSLQMHVCLECVVVSTHFCLFCNGMYAPQLPPPQRRTYCSPSVVYTEAVFSFFVDFVLFTNDLCISLFW